MKYKRYIPYFSAVLCTAVYLSLVFNDNIWLDEAFSASIIRCGYKEMLSRTIADTLPPFYNLSAWLFTHIFGFSTIGLKIFSVLPVFLLMLVSASVAASAEDTSTEPERAPHAGVTYTMPEKYKNLKRFRQSRDTISVASPSTFTLSLNPKSSSVQSSVLSVLQRLSFRSSYVLQTTED